MLVIFDIRSFNSLSQCKPRYGIWDGCSWCDFAPETSITVHESPTVEIRRGFQGTPVSGCRNGLAEHKFLSALPRPPAGPHAVEKGRLGCGSWWDVSTAVRKSFLRG